MSECYVEVLPAAGGPQVRYSAPVSDQFYLSETFFTIVVAILVSLYNFVIVVEMSSLSL